LGYKGQFVAAPGGGAIGVATFWSTGTFKLLKVRAPSPGWDQCQRAGISYLEQPARKDLLLHASMRREAPSTQDVEPSCLNCLPVRVALLSRPALADPLD